MKCTKPKKLALVFCLTAALASAALQGQNPGGYAGPDAGIHHTG
ncbi:unknown [Enterocloster bolteae CAG:59]|nr:unknown [Enterocloster bolteae CAG:59]